VNKRVNQESFSTFAADAGQLLHSSERLNLPQNFVNFARYFLLMFSTSVDEVLAA